MLFFKNVNRTGLSSMGRIHKILIANRGEIAVRVIRTAQKLGIRTVAIYSKIDEDSLHVAKADEAWCIGDIELSDTYLNIPRIVDLAVKTGCDAIHPGYGFLAENAGFGFDKIDENWKAYNSTLPDYQIEFDSVIIDFRLEAESELNDKLEKTVEKTVEKIISLIRENPTITAKQIEEMTKLSRRGVEYNLDKLKNEGRLKRIGADKGGYWQVTE